MKMWKCLKCPGEKGGGESETSAEVGKSETRPSSFNHFLFGACSAGSSTKVLIKQFLAWQRRKKYKLLTTNCMKHKKKKNRKTSRTTPLTYSVTFESTPSI